MWDLLEGSGPLSGMSSGALSFPLSLLREPVWTDGRSTQERCLSGMESSNFHHHQSFRVRCYTPRYNMANLFLVCCFHSCFCSFHLIVRYIISIGVNRHNRLSAYTATSSSLLKQRFLPVWICLTHVCSKYGRILIYATNGYDVQGE